MLTGAAARRRLTLLVVVAAGLSVAAPTNLASAHGGDPGKVHGCVQSSGLLRIVTAGTTCRPEEQALDWSTTLGLQPYTVTGEGANEGNHNGHLQLATVGRGNLVDGAVDGSKLADGSVSATKLSAPFLDALVTEPQLDGFRAALKADDPSSPPQPNDDDGYVHWNNLEDVPVSLQDGQVSLDELADLSNNIASSHIKDGTVTAADLAGEYSQVGSGPAQETIAGAVTGEKILDGTIEERDLSSALAQRLADLERKVTDLENKVAALEAAAQE